MRVIVAGGGTGGHVIPALAIAQELHAKHAAQVLFIGTARGIETRLVPAAGFELRLIEVGALNRVDFSTRLKTVLELPRALIASARLLRDFRPHVIIGVGGYASGPAMIAAAMMNVPSVAFEPNVIPGVANRLVAPMVSAAAVHFEATCRYFRNCHLTGVPVRSQFFEVPPRPKDARPTLLVFGGSQGAHAINYAVLQALPGLRDAVPSIHIIHQTGEKDYAEAQATYLQVSVSAEISAFIDDMPGAFARADLLLCRSGASTVAEVTAAGKPAIFVPLPTAADDHQAHNATVLVEGRAARLISQSQLTTQRLVTEVTSLLQDRQELARMSNAARRFAHAEAAAEIAALAPCGSLASDSLESHFSMFAKIQHVHFLGIGGIGMSGIAEVLLNLGYKVSGSDLKPSPVTARLAALGAVIYEGHRAENVAGAEVVIVSSAVPRDNPEVVAAHERHIPVIQRAEMLAELMRLKYGIAIAGMHGKTTTTSMVAAVLAAGGLDPTVVVGGRVDAMGSNARLGKSQYLVAEADESDRSFLKLSPILAVVTNLDREHMDCYRDMEDVGSAHFASSWIACLFTAWSSHVTTTRPLRHAVAGRSAQGIDVRNPRRRSDFHITGCALRTPQR